MDLYQEFRALITALEAAEVTYAVCGGVAVTLHGHPRLTKDIDLLVRAEDLGVLRETVGPLGFTIDAGSIPFDVGTPREREIYRVSKGEGEELLTLDLVIVNPALEEVWRTREHFVWEGSALSVVSREGLARMKRLAARAQDIADLAALGFEKDDADA